MALFKTGDHTAVLVLVDRIEHEGSFFTPPGETKKYPIIKFERPPELCGILEPVSKNVHEALYSCFINALIGSCRQHNIHTIQCAGTHTANAARYRNDLAHAHIHLEDDASQALSE